ncbi:MAG: hypothetical protein WCS27_09080 [Victivallaceae bacterium]|jgi:hypothetical protein
MKHFLTTLLILLWMNYVFSQSKQISKILEDVRGIHIFEFQIHKDLKPYIFKLYGNKKSNHIEKIEIIIKGEASPFQSIYTISQSPYKDAKYFEAVDMNFDGYKDIKLLDWWGATGNKGYRCWLYSPEKKRFYINTDLWKLCSPQFDYKKKKIYEYSNGGHTGMIYSASTWTLIGGKLICVGSESQEYVKEKNHYLRKRFKLINGKMVEVEQKIIKEKTY